MNIKYKNIISLAIVSLLAAGCSSNYNSPAYQAPQSSPSTQTQGTAPAPSPAPAPTYP